MIRYMLFIGYTEGEYHIDTFENREEAVKEGCDLRDAFTDDPDYKEASYYLKKVEILEIIPLDK